MVMADYDDDGVPYVVIERSGSGLVPFVWGALLGAAAALLLAVPWIVAPECFALEVSVTASRDAVTVGEQFTVAVEVRHDGVGSVPKPDLPLPDNVRAVNGDCVGARNPLFDITIRVA